MRTQSENKHMKQCNVPQCQRRAHIASVGCAGCFGCQHKRASYRALFCLSTKQKQGIKSNASSLWFHRIVSFGCARCRCDGRWQSAPVEQAIRKILPFQQLRILQKVIIVLQQAVIVLQKAIIVLQKAIIIAAAAAAVSAEAEATSAIIANKTTFFMGCNQERWQRGSRWRRQSAHL